MYQPLTREQVLAVEFDIKTIANQIGLTVSVVWAHLPPGSYWNDAHWFKNRVDHIIRTYLQDFRWFNVLYNAETLHYTCNIWHTDDI